MGRVAADFERILDSHLDYYEKAGDNLFKQHMESALKYVEGNPEGHPGFFNLVRMDLSVLMRGNTITELEGMTLDGEYSDSSYDSGLITIVFVKIIRTMLNWLETKGRLNEDLRNIDQMLVLASEAGNPKINFVGSIQQIQTPVRTLLPRQSSVNIQTLQR